MRKSRFAALGEPVATTPSLAWADVLLFDLRTPRLAGDVRIAGDRVRTLSSAGPYLAASHFICGLVVCIHVLKGDWAAQTLFALLPLAGVLGIAACATIFLNRQRTHGYRPHRVVRLWGAFVLTISALWCVVLEAGLPDDPSAVPAIVHAALLGAFCLTVVAFMSIPSLLVASYLGGVVAFILFPADKDILGLIVAFGGCLVGASLFGARGALIAAARQLALEARANKAASFVAEFEQSGRGWFWETDADGALTYVSEQLSEDFGLAEGELVGRRFTELLADDHGPGDGVQRTLGFHLSARLPFNDINVRAKDPSEIWWSLSGSPHFDDYGRYLGFGGIGTDLTEQRRAEAEINRLARYDALTGLPNRTLMRATLEEALRGIERQKKGCALFLIDLDRFKNVNDTLGHPIGDALLVQVTQRLVSVVGEEGQVGRIGGDEFQAVFPAIASDAWLASTARRMIEKVANPYMIEGHNISIGASIGIAVAQTQYQCADALIRDADLALYAAKDDGRGTFRIFAPDMHSEAKERQTLENDLRGAVERGELRLLYQPVVNTVTEQVVAFESLVRWIHPARGSINPDLFISLAEECGLIVSVGEWVLRTACEEAARWPSQIRIAVNISPIQFANPNLVTVVMNILAATGLDPNRLELEITEGVFLSEGADIDETFRRLKSAGVRIALDDFGTGYSSLGYLKRAPLDKIKIDQSFVRGAAATGSTSEAILRSIISLAQSLGMDTTAEGVETHDDLRLIRKLGCSQVQGYIFGKPLEIGEARARAASVEAVEASGFENNRPPRFSLIKKASLQWNGMSFPVRIRNISIGGALLDSPRGLPPGASVQLDLPGCGNCGATVRWSEEGKLGIHFEAPFDLRLLGSATEARSGGVLRPSYLDSELKTDSPWAGRNERLSPKDLPYGRTG